MITPTAKFACDPGASLGRFQDEPASRTRSVYQRDRDRIIHCAAFRRLKHKTQVFVYHEGDHYRTRLTHSLEVAQITRSLSRTLGLNEDLAEAIALAHDLGHTPFGHAGEGALDRCMTRFGGFDHNAQAFRLVTRLEGRYANFQGLNLTLETLEGLVKHNGPLKDKNGRAVGPAGTSRLPYAIRDFKRIDELRLDTFAPAEAQVAALSDDIAYNAHDIDDGLRANLFNMLDIADVPLVGEALSDVVRRYPDLEKSRMAFETVRRVITSMADDLLKETGLRVKQCRPDSVDSVRENPVAIIAFSDKMNAQSLLLKQFLAEHMYHTDIVTEKMNRAKRVVKDLFDVYSTDNSALPVSWRSETPADVSDGSMRRVCDFIAGMTDRYALDEHRRLFDLDPLFR